MAHLSVVWSLRGDDDAVADFVADRVRPDRACQMAIAGGHTPRAILRKLAARKLAWNRVEMVPTDERLVPDGSASSNYRMIAEAMRDSAAWVSHLQQMRHPPHFDLVWLGMGDDGKIASIFPGQAIDDDDEPSVLVSEPDPLPPKAPFRRVTLNYAALANAAATILVVRGQHKRRMVEAALASPDMPLTRFCRRLKGPLQIFWHPN